MSTYFVLLTAISQPPCNFAQSVWGLYCLVQYKHRKTVGYDSFERLSGFLLDKYHISVNSVNMIETLDMIVLLCKFQK